MEFYVLLNLRGRSFGFVGGYAGNRVLYHSFDSYGKIDSRYMILPLRHIWLMGAGGADGGS